MDTSKLTSESDMQDQNLTDVMPTVESKRMCERIGGQKAGIAENKTRSCENGRLFFSKNINSATKLAGYLASMLATI